MTLLTRFLVSFPIIASIVFGQAGGPGQQVIDDGTGQKSVPLRTHSLHAPYLDSDLQSRWLFPWELC
jgi:hypothetical protein